MESDQCGGYNFIKISTQPSLGICVNQKAQPQQVPLVDTLLILSYAGYAAEVSFYQPSFCLSESVMYNVVKVVSVCFRIEDYILLLQCSNP